MEKLLVKWAPEHKIDYSQEEGSFWRNYVIIEICHLCDENFCFIKPVSSYIDKKVTSPHI